MTGWHPRHKEGRRKDFTGAKNRAQRCRKTPWPTEARPWRLLRVLNKEGASLRRQASVGPFVFDVASLSRRVLIEIDGRVHDRPDVKVADDEKAAFAENSGYRVIRIANDDVWRMPDVVLDRLRAVLFAGDGLLSPHAPHPSPSPEGEGDKLHRRARSDDAEP